MRELRARWMWGRLPGWLRRLVEIGALASDSEEVRIRKAVLVLSSTLMASLSCVWVVTYAVLGLWLSAIPLVYQLVSAASVYAFARTRRYMLFRRRQLWMSLVLPFVLQWSVGGFRNSSAVCLWGKGRMTTYLLLSRRGNQASAGPDAGAGVARTAALESPTFAAAMNADARDPRSR